MKLSVNDPKITAYALGEIDDPKEREAMKAAVAASVELQQAVQDIREMANLLSEGLASEPAPDLSEFDKARMEKEPGKQPAARKNVLNYILTWPALSAAVAAAVVAMVFVPQGLLMYKAEEEAVDEAAEIEERVVQLAPPAMPELDDTDTSQMELAKPPSLAQLELSMAADHIRTTNAEEVMPQSFAVPAAKMEGYRQSGDLIGTAVMPPPEVKEWNTESYDPIEETDFRSPLVAPLSTFSIDVDTASYANVRRFLNMNQLPPADAVRIEELINYFPYADKPPVKSLEEGGDPFAVHMAQTTAPWNTDHRLLRIALKGYEMPWEERPASNLVFLLDVSGSMNDPNKLPLVKKAMDLLVHRLDGRDREPRASSCRRPRPITTPPLPMPWKISVPVDRPMPEPASSWPTRWPATTSSRTAITASSSAPMVISMSARPTAGTSLMLPMSRRKMASP